MTARSIRGERIVKQALAKSKIIRRFIANYDNGYFEKYAETLFLKVAEANPRESEADLEDTTAALVALAVLEALAREAKRP